MKNWMIGLLAGLVQTAAQAADSVLYLDNVLTVNDAIVMEGEAPRYYRDVQLEITATGDFRVINAVEKTLAYIDELTVGVSLTDPVTVELNVVGFLANPCIELNTAVVRKDNTFFVAIGETQTMAVCAQVIVPFDITLPLDVAGLPAGEYRAMVNGDVIAFTLD